MHTMTIDRATPMDDLLSLMGVDRLIAIRRGDAALLTPDVIDPDDYDNDTDYINAVPGLAEKILAARNSPRSEDVSYHELWDDGDV